MGDRRAVLLLAVILLAVCAAGLWAWGPLVRITTGAAGLLLGTRLTVLACRHVRLASALRRDSVPGDCHGISLRWRAWQPGAAVAGLRRPQIYCHPALATSLTRGELAAVLLHERHHQLRRDPLRLLLLAAVAPVARLVPGGRSWLARRTAAIEVAADRFALGHGAARRDLAGALLKIGSTVPAPAAAFGAATDLRLRALLGEETHLGPPDTVVTMVVALAVVAVACSAALIHHVAASASTVGCLLAVC